VDESQICGGRGAATVAAAATSLPPRRTGAMSFSYRTPGFDTIVGAGIID
jgi:hypothetical protein